MDSPESNRIVTTSSSPAVQDSPFFNYLSNLSPIKPVKTVHVAQGFSELNFPAPAPVFTSPRINTQRDVSFLKRPQYPHPSKIEFSQHDDRMKVLAAGSHTSEPPVTQSMVDTIDCTQNKCDSTYSLEVHPCSPSECIDEYLADPVDVDSANSADSVDSCLKQSNDVPREIQSHCTSSKETILKSNIEIDAGKDTDSEVLSSHTSLEQAGENLLRKSLLPLKLVDAEGKQKDGEKLFHESLCVIPEKVNGFLQSDLPTEPASATQNGENPSAELVTDYSLLESKKKEQEGVGIDRERSALSASLCHNRPQDVKLQNAEVGQQDEWNCTPQLLHESLQIVQACEGHVENSGAISNGSENRISHDFEAASQHQRGTLRRCLQFEIAEAQRNILGTSCCQNTQNVMTNPGLPANSKDSEILVSSHHEPSTTSSIGRPVNLSQLIAPNLSICATKNTEAHMEKVDKPVQNSENALMIAPKASGIGLHLNSIVNSVAMGSGATASVNSTEKDRPSLLGMKSQSVINYHFPEDPNTSSHSTSTAENFSYNNDDRQESQAIVLASTVHTQSPRIVKPMGNLKSKLIEHHTTPCDAKRSALENANKFEELNQLSPKKKRKRVSYTTENVGCKRCNCKRSKCLKLYCECFAAGVYCTEPCACLECFNKPEYEDTVLSTRQQIESRNPLAFAPKIVCRVTEFPANSGEDSIRMTPSSARHKRGCNCKKSMCLKKYCECFQAGVGCSEGCRCEGCKNVYGMKEEILYKRADEKREDVSGKKMGMVETRSEILHSEQCHPQHLSPLTPSFQCSNHGKDILRSRLPVRRYLPSPESDTTVLSSYGKSPLSPVDSNNNERQQKMNVEIVDMISYDQDVDCLTSGEMDQFSPRWDGLVDMCDLTPKPHPSSRAMVSSASSNSKDCKKVLRAQLCHRNGRLSAISSLRQSSPITPVTQLGGSKFPQESDSDSALYGILEDDTPDILKDTPTPIKAVKASSPNQKRVSPPHSRLHELRSSSSPGLRSGRKFILQAVPSFPPLTPYSDPKSCSSEK